MTKRLRIAALAAALALLPTSLLAAEVLATVNGKKLTQDDFAAYVRESGISQKAATQNRDRIIEELVGRELVYQDALKKKLDKSPEVIAQLEELRYKVLLNAAVHQALSRNPITEKELKAAYNQRVGNASKQEYKARHILLKSEADAKQVIKELDKGADFAELAKKRSTGPSGRNGGDLGWFSAKEMVPQFAAAVAKMKKGTYTETPVKTQFGYHVIKLEDTRQAKPPAFEQVRDQLEKTLERQRVGEYVTELKKTANVKMK